MPRRREATYEDVLALPEHLVGEIIDGELFVSARPAPRHAVATGDLFLEIAGPFQRGRGGPGGWWILIEPELHLGRNVMVPDLAGWRRERMPELPDAAFIDVAPDWVCEVLSVGNARLDRAKKLPKYARAGVGHAWLVDPLARTLEVYRREAERWLLLDVHEGDAVVRAEPFDAVELPLAGLWPPQGAPAPGPPTRRRRGPTR